MSEMTPKAVFLDEMPLPASPFAPCAPEYWFGDFDETEVEVEAEAEVYYPSDNTFGNEGILETASPEECRGFLVMFFAGKQMHFGGPIPSHLLLSDRNVEIVRRLDLSECIQLFHECMEDIPLRPAIEKFFELQTEARKLGIPKHHSGGLLLVWLNLCKGIDL